MPRFVAMTDAAPMADPAEIQGELWGANMIARNLRRRMRARVMLESLDARRPGVRSRAALYNMVLLGPAGAGKSSLIYTLWRALHFRAAGAATDETAAPDDGGDGGDDPPRRASSSRRCSRGSRSAGTCSRPSACSASEAAAAARRRAWRRARPRRAAARGTARAASTHELRDRPR